MRSWSCSGSAPGGTGSATRGGRQFGGGGLVGGGPVYSAPAAFAVPGSRFAAAAGVAPTDEFRVVCAGRAQAASSGRGGACGRSGGGPGSAGAAAVSPGGRRQTSSFVLIRANLSRSLPGA